MSDQSGIKKVEYQCNKCQKQRNLNIPSKLLKTDTLSAILEFVDVHRCAQDNLSAIKCFIDSFLTVRSQVHIKSTHYGYETDRDFSSVEDEQDLYKSLGIPIPQKVAMTKKEYDTKTFERKNISGFQITDKIRNSMYIFQPKEAGKQIIIKSILGFIEIKMIISEKIVSQVYKDWKAQLKSAPAGEKTFPFTEIRKWIQNVADTLESLVYLDEVVLKLIAEFLDDNIVEEPTERNLVELDLLVNSTIAFPKSSSDGLRRFNTEQATLLQELSPNLVILCKELMVFYLTNHEKSILDTYIEMNPNQSFPQFLFAMSHLVYKYYLTINKLEFS
ncbi:MAG: hypothetical protein GOP50_09880 [Candidatus Heimdallarchaeota archaeon]|nr:hypothetical protein [Candidatus Heimdallarchaeota archaeon]